MVVGRVVGWVESSRPTGGGLLALPVGRVFETHRGRPPSAPGGSRRLDPPFWTLRLCGELSTLSVWTGSFTLSLGRSGSGCKRCSSPQPPAASRCRGRRTQRGSGRAYPAPSWAVFCLDPGRAWHAVRSISDTHNRRTLCSRP